MKKIYSFLILLFFLTTTSHAQVLQQVYVLNEGAFNNANASVTSFNPVSNQVSQNVFFNANARPLGDIANFSKIINDKLYIIVSNSNKIEVVDPETFVSEDIIFVDDQGGASPTVFAQADENRLYITNLLGDNVSILDLNTHTITGNIEVGNNPEGIAVANGFAYVAVNTFGSDNKLVIIDISTDEVVKTLTVQDNPRYVFTPSDGLVWVLCTGNYGFDDDFNFDPELETFGEIHIIDPQTNEVVEFVETGGHPLWMDFNEADGKAYILNDGIQVLNMDNLEMEEELLTDKAYYSLAFWHGENPVIFAGFAPDFSSSGTVDILSVQGDVIDTFTAGIGPSFFQFIYDDTATSAPRDQIASRISLEQNYPNPFNPSTEIRYEISEAGNVRLNVFNIQGQLIQTLVDSAQPAGSHTARFNATGLSSGVYIYTLETNNGILTRKMTLVK